MGRRGIRAWATAAAVVGAALAVGAGVTHADATSLPTVTSGHARFEVLSPTLIRMEYAGDDTFTDAATFNAIGRDHTDEVLERLSGLRLTDDGHPDITCLINDGLAGQVGLAEYDHADLVAGRNPVRLRSRRLRRGGHDRPRMNDDGDHRCPATTGQRTPSIR